MGDDRPPVCRRDRPFVPGHQPGPVRDDVEDLPVRVVQDLLLVEGRGGDVAALEQDPLAVPASVVARLAIDGGPLAAALEHRVVHGDGTGFDELPVRSLAREEGRVLFQPADRHRSGNRLAHRGAVVEEGARRLGAHLRLIIHARIEMDGRAARGAAARASGGADNDRERQGTEHHDVCERSVIARLPARDSDCAPWPGRSSAAWCSAPRAAHSCVDRSSPSRPGSIGHEGPRTRSPTQGTPAGRRF